MLVGEILDRHEEVIPTWDPRDAGKGKNTLIDCYLDDLWRVPTALVADSEWRVFDWPDAMCRVRRDEFLGFAVAEAYRCGWCHRVSGIRVRRLEVAKTCRQTC